MKSSRKKETERGVRKRRPRKLFQMLLPLYVLIFAVSQLYFPTGASFNDVTKIEETLLANDYLPSIENPDIENVQKVGEDKQKETSMDNEQAGSIDGEQVDPADGVNQELPDVANEDLPTNESTILDHQEEGEKMVIEDQLAENQTNRSESDNESEGDAELD